ncbi:MAG: relaxase/mobilization nuclease domain-containing protein [Coriobacteriales bacterium]|jgi:hypothetical protein|nr:relaxase/mobilization nuclease domain-containing protein [Coriobacteriales bacterium]
MATTRLMPLHTGKGRTVGRAISDIIDYVKNPEKTDFGRLISSYGCDSRTADAEFLLSKRQYAAATGRVRGSDDVIAYHTRQSFRPGEVTPEEANRIGYELAISLTKGNNAFVVCTHIDKAHIHNHIIINSTSMDCTRKFRNFLGSAWALRRISDTLCVKHGLSVINDPKPSRGSYGTWLGEDKTLSFHDRLRQHIVNYARTRDVYVAYRKAGYSRKFKDEHEADILIHQAAKNVFDGLGVKKLPTIRSLREQYATHLAEKKRAYASYKKAKAEMRELQTVKANVDSLLNMSGRERGRQETRG